MVKTKWLLSGLPGITKGFVQLVFCPTVWRIVSNEEKTSPPAVSAAVWPPWQPDVLQRACKIGRISVLKSMPGPPGFGSVDFFLPQLKRTKEEKYKAAAIRKTFIRKDKEFNAITTDYGGIEF
jgi:hypothetical protein